MAADTSAPALITASAVIATKDRAFHLAKLLDSLASWPTLPREIIIVDASSDPSPARVVTDKWRARIPHDNLVCLGGAEPGAAAQRRRGVERATEPFIWFLDDDVVLESDCAARMSDALQGDQRLGGVNAMIVNQRYRPPGRVSRSLFTVMNGRGAETFAGRVLGPAVNLLPEDRDDLPEVVPTEWLNTTCTMYRREALPDPPFDPVFTGYSLMEDLALSLNVAKRGWKLANVRGARIFHDSQPGDHKADAAALAAMEIVNRHYVMTRVLERRSLRDYLKLGIFELFQLASGAVQNPRSLPRTLRGKFRGLRRLVTHSD